MSKYVFILGAGASVNAGAPLMNGFLDKAEEIYTLGKADNEEDHFKLLFKGYHALKETYAKASIEIDNIEALFTAFEMARLLGSLGKLNGYEIEQLPTAATRVIVKTLQNSVKFPIHNKTKDDHEPLVFSDESVLGIPKSYIGLGKMFRRKKFDASIITFNYDLCLDYTLKSMGVKINYCLDSNVAGKKLLKLHGSLNWAFCDSCNEVFILDCFNEDGIIRLPSTTSGVYEGLIDVISVLKRAKHCDTTPTKYFIVPPTISKTQHQAQIERVWQAAAKELSNAEEIFICGYSLPETDMFFRYLYAIGTIGESRIKKLWVYNPDRSDDFAKRYEDLLGPLVKPNRFLIHPRYPTFSDSISFINNDI